MMFNNSMITAITIIMWIASPPTLKTKPPSSQLMTKITTIRYNKLLIFEQPAVGENVSYILLANKVTKG